MTLLPLDPDELLTTTRSVRKRLDLKRPVEPAIIERALEVALHGVNKLVLCGGAA